jgi:hypothetical protein
MFESMVSKLLSSANWAEFVAQMLLLECLRMPHSLYLLANVLRIQVDNCHRLCNVSLHDEYNMEALNDGLAVMPCFSYLLKLKIDCFGNHGNGKRYVTLGTLSLPPTPLLAHYVTLKRFTSYGQLLTLYCTE